MQHGLSFTYSANATSLTSLRKFELEILANSNNDAAATPEQNRDKILFIGMKVNEF